MSQGEVKLAPPLEEANAYRMELIVELLRVVGNRGEYLDDLTRCTDIEEVVALLRRSPYRLSEDAIGIVLSYDARALFGDLELNLRSELDDLSK